MSASLSCSSCSHAGRCSCASQDLLVIFISLELLSLSLYILTAFDKNSAQSSEAALKYFLFGGMSAAFLLFGFSLLYGLSNSTSLLASPARFRQLCKQPPSQPATGHRHRHYGDRAWLQGRRRHLSISGRRTSTRAHPLPAPLSSPPAPRSRASSSSFRSWSVGFAGAEGSARWLHFVRGWVPVLAIVAALSMVLGNLVAIVQSTLRRLLAYSAIAHAGYMLLALVAHTQQSLAALLYYVVTYALATLGAFAVIAVVEGRTGGDQLSDFDGLSRRAPVLSACLFIFLLSLAGIPPLAGFFGKFYLFVSVLAGRRARSALAGDPRHRHERGIALLLSAGAEENVRRQSCH